VRWPLLLLGLPEQQAKGNMAGYWMKAKLPVYGNQTAQRTFARAPSFDVPSQQRPKLPRDLQQSPVQIGFHFGTGEEHTRRTWNLTETMLTVIALPAADRKASNSPSSLWHTVTTQSPNH
jgi:hypothetical protein